MELLTGHYICCLVTHILGALQLHIILACGVEEGVGY